MEGQPQPNQEGFKHMFRQRNLWAGGCCLLLLLLAASAWQRGLSQNRRSEKSPFAIARRRARVRMVSRRPLGGDIPPETTVWDPYPTFNGIALDTENNRVVMSDINRMSVLMYNRLANSKAGELTVPLRHIFGPATRLGSVAGVAVDPEKKEIFVAENDAWGVRMFSYDDQGDASPRRTLAAPHQTWGLSLSLLRREIALSVEELDAVVVYKEDADKLDPPLRVIRGDKTGMADPHGIYLDGVNDEIFVANHGSRTAYMPNTGHDKLPPIIPRVSGHFEMPSIRVYPALAQGNVKPIRTIQGRRTTLDWPMQIDVDTSHDELAVANFGANSIAIFNRTDNGDVAPERVIRGPHTGIVGPVGVAIDAKNNEIWVANYGDHTALVFPRTANGDVSPKRIVRNAPAQAPTCGFTDASATTYDSKRHEILVAN